MTTKYSHESTREEKTKKWIIYLNPEDCNGVKSVISSIIELSIADSSNTDSGVEQQLDVTNNHHTTTHLNKSQNSTDITKMPNFVVFLDCVPNQLHQPAQSDTFSSINISNSKNVMFGNTLQIDGDVNIIVINNNDETAKDKYKQKQNEKYETDIQACTKTDNGAVLEQKGEIDRAACVIISRRRWLTMDLLKELISHKATTSSTNQAGNIGIIRDIQALHIKGWNDIIYNYLIGCNGNVYEGRAWGIDSHHTFGYNNTRIGITFVGTFLSKL